MAFGWGEASRNQKQLNEIARANQQKQALKNQLDYLNATIERDKARRAREEQRKMAATNYSGSSLGGLNPEDQKRFIEALRGTDSSKITYGTAWSTGTGTEGILPPLTNSEGVPPEPTESKEMTLKEQRRRDPNSILWSDLEPGDKFEFRGYEYEVTEVDSKFITVNKAFEGTSTNKLEKNRRKITQRGDVHIISLHTNSSPKKGGVSFDSVILHEKKKASILAAIKQIDNHDLIFKTWGFENTFEKGTAISMLFYGPPGTGKTLMAQAIADRFSYEMKLISTADIETPEPGGAERNIRKAFEEAGQNTVLLFDECDSLVSSRKHMGSILAAQVNCLLTELEHYKGIVVFTTNRIETLDEAFDRRLSLKLEFEMPDEEEREKIWKRMFPKKAPLSKGVDFKALASVEIAGGHIKNVVLKAARMAANLDVPNNKKKITQKILVEALAQEVKSNAAFVDAIENKHQFFGTPIMNRGKGRLEINRG